MKLPHTLSLLLPICLLAACQETAPPPAAAIRPALTVSATQAQTLEWPQQLAASGNIAAWQEAIIGAEVGNLRITEVLVQIGDRVRRGQVLARLDQATLDSELAESRAAVAEAEAVLAEAKANNERSRQLRERGFYSAQQGTQTQTAADTALARLNAARARLQSTTLRHAKAAITAPDDGIIATRNATVGSLSEVGRELFRLIRGGRLEWRAEVTAAELPRLKPGQTARLELPNGGELIGKVRIVAPTADLQTRNALVYVDLPADPQGLGAGMFARGEFNLGQHAALTVPQSAVVQREGFAYVFQLEPPDSPQTKVSQRKITLGRQQGDRLEVLDGLDANTRLVASGAGFLADGDQVRVVPAP